jgi:hypothetical protein
VAISRSKHISIFTCLSFPSVHANEAEPIVQQRSASLGPDTWSGSGRTLSKVSIERKMRQEKREGRERKNAKLGKQREKGERQRPGKKSNAENSDSFMFSVRSERTLWARHLLRAPPTIAVSNSKRKSERERETERKREREGCFLPSSVSTILSRSILLFSSFSISSRVPLSPVSFFLFLYPSHPPSLLQKGFAILRCCCDCG